MFYANKSPNSSVAGWVKYKGSNVSKYRNYVVTMLKQNITFEKNKIKNILLLKNI